MCVSTWTGNIARLTRVYAPHRTNGLLTTEITLVCGDTVTVVGGAEMRWFDHGGEYRVVPISYQNERYYVLADDLTSP
jgi:hypothetical protein